MNMGDWEPAIIVFTPLHDSSITMSSKQWKDYLWRVGSHDEELITYRLLNMHVYKYTYITTIIISFSYYISFKIPHRIHDKV